MLLYPSIELERAANRINVTIKTAKPGMVIGKGGSEVESLRQSLNALTGKKVHVNIFEVKQPDLMRNWLRRILHVNWKTVFHGVVLRNKP